MNKRAVVLISLGLGALYLWSKTAAGGKMTTSKILNFVTGSVGAARAAGAEYNLPVWLFLTAGAHESAAGLSGLAIEANNFFGFTADDPKSNWRMAGKPTVQKLTHEWVKKPGVNDKVESGPDSKGMYYVSRTRYFRKYPSLLDSFRDYARLLTTRARYAPAVAAAREGDVAGAFKALGTSGYATDPTYGKKLAGVYKSVKEYTV